MFSQGKPVSDHHGPEESWVMSDSHRLNPLGCSLEPWVESLLSLFSGCNVIANATDVDARSLFLAKSTEELIVFFHLFGLFDEAFSSGTAGAALSLTPITFAYLVTFLFILAVSSQPKRLSPFILFSSASLYSWTLKLTPPFQWTVHSQPPHVMALTRNYFGILKLA